MELSSEPVGEAVGRSLPRVDGVAKVTGRARYLDDVDAAGAWHGVTVRSTVAHADLDALELDPAFDWSQVAVVTAADIAAAGGRNLVALLEVDQPALVPIGGRIRHVDEAVALVAAPTRARAFAAAAAVRLEVEELPAVLSIEDALKADVRLHGEDNVFKRFELSKGGPVEAALAGADLIIEGTYRTSAQEQMYIEPQGMIARYQDGACHFIGSLQCPYYVHKAMKVLLDLPDDKVIVAQSVTGGGFGGKEE